MPNSDFIARMPKIDLHCHLDGSLPIETIYKLAKNAGLSLPTDPNELLKQLTVSDECQSLQEYLTCFSLPVACLQTEENLYIAAYDLMAEVAKENVIYLEVRFAPTLSVNENMDLDQVVASVLRGLEAAKEEYSVDYGLILCAMRHHKPEVNAQLLPVAKKYYGRGVVALDLAGDETIELKQHERFFAEAAEMGIPYTIHAGEAAGSFSCKAALACGAKRLGHGITLKDDPELMNYCLENSIGVELCPVSNLQTKAAVSWAEYPFQLFFEQGLLVTINTDNRMVSQTNLKREFTELTKVYSLGLDQLEELFRNAVEISFTDLVKKEEMLKSFAQFKQEEASV